MLAMPKIDPLRTLIYLVTLVGFVFVFFYLHYLGNKLPVDLATQQIRDAFVTDNLIQSSYPFEKFGSHSVRSLIGQDQFTECQSLQAMLYQSDGSWRDAIILKKNSVSGRGHCQAVYEIVNGISEPKTVSVRTRYWWGWIAIYSIALNWLNIFQIVLGIKLLTYFSYLCLSVAALSHSRRMLVTLSPMIIYGFFFSGISYYGGVTLSLSYLWSIVALTLLVLLLRHVNSDSAMKLVFFIFGIVSSFLSSFDGHLMLLVPYSLAILFLGIGDRYTIRDKIILAVYCLIFFVLGFTASLLVNQLVKSFYIGWDKVYGNFYQGMAYRLSDDYFGKEIDPLRMLSNLFKSGFGVVGCFKIRGLCMFLILGAVFAGLTGLALTIITSLRRKKTEQLLSLFFFTGLIAFVFVRLLAFQNHSAIHTLFIGRYMFVPLSLLWLILVHSVYGLFENSTPSEVADDQVHQAT